MSYQRNYWARSGGGGALYDYQWPSFNLQYLDGRNRNMDLRRNDAYPDWNYYRFPDYSSFHELKFRENVNSNDIHVNSHDVVPTFKRRKFSASTWGEDEVQQPPVYNTYVAFPSRSNAEVSTSAGCKRDRSLFEDEEPVLMSRYEIERCSPSRKDGIDLKHEIHLRYSYCAFLQNLGIRLDLPQTTIGTAMVLCHRFFVRRSHACNDRFLIATAALFLAAKSEETARPLNDVLKASSEILYKQNFAVLSFRFPVGWFEQYRERVIEAEQMILTTLNFELNVQHPYTPLTSVLNKLGLSQTMLVNLALNLISEGLRSSLWLQFKPHHIAAGAAYLAAKFLNLDLTSYHTIWQEFQTTPAILHDVAQQLTELF